jgi:hypothetical protein
MADAKIVGKISLRDVGISAAQCEALVQDGTEPMVMQVIGKCTDYTKKPSSLGGDRISFCFLGKFQGTNAITGDTYRASKLYLPEIAETQLIEEVTMAKEANASAVIEFGFNVGLQQNKSTKPNASKYKFLIVPLFAPSEESDPLASLLKKVKGLPALTDESPKTPAKKK